VPSGIGHAATVCGRRQRALDSYDLGLARLIKSAPHFPVLMKVTVQRWSIVFAPLQRIDPAHFRFHGAEQLRLERGQRG
jgi:hypothetical protein